MRRSTNKMEVLFAISPVGGIPRQLLDAILLVRQTGLRGAKVSIEGLSQSDDSIVDTSHSQHSIHLRGAKLAVGADVIGAVANVAAVQPITAQYHVVATNHSSLSHLKSFSRLQNGSVHCVALSTGLTVLPSAVFTTGSWARFRLDFLVYMHRRKY